MKKRLLTLMLALVMLLGCGCTAVQNTEKNADIGAGNFAVKSDDPVPSDAAVTELSATTSLVEQLKAEDWSYVRGGSYADLTSDQMEGGSDIICAKSDSKADFSRQFYLRFDVSGLGDVISSYSTAKMVFGFKHIDADKDSFNIYQITEDVNISELTWNTKVNGTQIAENTSLRAIVSFDYISAVRSAIANNNGILILRFEQTLSSLTPTDINCADGGQPYLTFFSSSSSSYITDFFEESEENDAVWAYAKTVYDEWYERYQQVLETEYPMPELIESDESQYAIEVRTYGPHADDGEDAASPRKTRTFAQLNDMGDYTDLNIEHKYDEYGGIIDPALKQEVTGFFYTKKLGDRWWVIDPLGYPCYIRALSQVTIEYSPNSKQKISALEKFGTEEKWALSTVRRVFDDLGFNISASPESSVKEVSDGLFYQVGTSSFAGGYGSTIGVNASVGGSTVFSEGNTMPVFDPGFVDFSKQRAESVTAKYVGDKRLLGYTTDNELPMQVSMLTDYLAVDPLKTVTKDGVERAVNVYSYACAWYWLVQQTGKSQPVDADITDELSELFRGFVWDRYFSVVCTEMRAAMKANGSNHMLLGTRFLTRVKNAEWVLKFAALHLDAITINWYSAWQPLAVDLQQMCQYGQLPIIVTEFYAKAKQNEEPELLIHTDTSAGWLVDTQADRGYFYQNFTLRLLECKNVVGWHWFQYLDCDPTGTQTDKSSQDSNKGIVSNTHTEYTDLTDRMIEINKNVYCLIDYFDNKYAAETDVTE